MALFQSLSFCWYPFVKLLLHRMFFSKLLRFVVAYPEGFDEQILTLLLRSPNANRFQLVSSSALFLPPEWYLLEQIVYYIHICNGCNGVFACVQIFVNQFCSSYNMVCIPQASRSPLLLTFLGSFKHQICKGSWDFLPISLYQIIIMYLMKWDSHKVRFHHHYNLQQKISNLEKQHNQSCPFVL